MSWTTRVAPAAAVTTLPQREIGLLSVSRRRLAGGPLEELLALDDVGHPLARRLRAANGRAQSAYALRVESKLECLENVLG